MDAVIIDINEYRVKKSSGKPTPPNDPAPTPIAMFPTWAVAA